MNKSWDLSGPCPQGLLPSQPNRPGREADAALRGALVCAAELSLRLQCLVQQE